MKRKPSHPKHFYLRPYSFRDTYKSTDMGGIPKLQDTVIRSMIPNTSSLILSSEIKSVFLLNILTLIILIS